jgi:hypothetical protein
MTDTQRIEALLEALLAEADLGSVTLPRKDAKELAQKLRARGEPGGAATLAEKLDTPGDVSLDPAEARALLEQLRASGRRWVFGTNEGRELTALKPPEREPEPEPVTEQKPGIFARLFGKRDE